MLASAESPHRFGITRCVCIEYILTSPALASLAGGSSARRHRRRRRWRRLDGRRGAHCTSSRRRGRRDADSAPAEHGGAYPARPRPISASPRLAPLRCAAPLSTAPCRRAAPRPTSHPRPALLLRSITQLPAGHPPPLLGESSPVPAEPAPPSRTPHRRPALFAARSAYPYIARPCLAGRRFLRPQTP